MSRNPVGAMGTARLSGALAVALILLTTTFAAAQPASDASTADQVFAAAREAFRARDFEGAAELFRRANTLRPSANTKFNEAQSWRRANRTARAADAYVAALSMEGLDPKLEAAGQRQLNTLRETLGQLQVHGADGLRFGVGHVTDLAAPHAMHLPPGDHRITVVGVDGRRATQQVTIEAGKTLRVKLKAPRPRPEKPQPTPKAEGPDPAWVAGWAVLGVGVAGGIAATVLGLRFNNVLDDYEASGFVDTSLEDEAHRLRTATNIVAFGSAALAVTGGVVLLTTALSQGDDEAVSLVVSPTALALRGTF